MTSSRRFYALITLMGMILWIGWPLFARNLIWVDVPLVSQEKNLCGAACIAMVWQYWRSALPNQVSNSGPGDYRFPDAAGPLSSKDANDMKSIGRLTLEKPTVFLAK